MNIARNQESVSMARLRARKGASRTATIDKNFLEKISLAKLLLLSSLIVAAVVFYGSYTAVQTVLDVPVSQVDVEGSFQYLRQEEVHQVINNYVVNGFVTVDLKKLRSELLELPWVKKAAIKRKLPNGLLVTMVEQKPLAYWNDDAMINDDGALFFPLVLPVIAELPRLRGKNHKVVMEVYGQLAMQLPVEQQPIRMVNVSESKVVHVLVSDEATLVFKAADLPAKIGMWKTISATELGRKLKEVEYVDLRYSNGAAVKWKDALDTQSKTKTGGV